MESLENFQREVKQIIAPRIEVYGSNAK